jgi:hypothetical protein
MVARTGGTPVPLRGERTGGTPVPPPPPPPAAAPPPPPPTGGTPVPLGLLVPLVLLGLLGRGIGWSG